VPSESQNPATSVIEKQFMKILESILLRVLVTLSVLRPLKLLCTNVFGNNDGTESA
jgi:hypothetical protein